MARRDKKERLRRVKRETDEAPSGRVSREERRQMIAEAAYYKAQKRAFRQGSAEKDWYEAEAEIDAQLETLAESREQED